MSLTITAKRILLLVLVLLVWSLSDPVYRSDQSIFLYRLYISNKFKPHKFAKIKKEMPGRHQKYFSILSTAFAIRSAQALRSSRDNTSTGE